MENIVFKLKLLTPFIKGGFIQWKDSIWEQDLDGPVCCSGRECGCEGETIRSAYSGKGYFQW